MKKYFIFILFVALVITGCTNGIKTPGLVINFTEKIQGRWVSVDDNSSMIEFVGEQKTDYYNNQKLSEGIFTLDDDLLTVVNGNEIYEYIILNITEQDLSLSFLPRGNTLDYRRLVVEVDDFNSCVAGGNPVLESYPRQCRSGMVDLLLKMLEMS